MKTAQIEIGGELRSLDFSRAGLNDHIETASGKPAFQFISSLIPEKDPEGKIVERNYTLTEISVLIYAGINSANDVSGNNVIDFETIKRWVRSIESDKIGNVFEIVINAMSDDKGEGKSQPEQGSN